MNTKVPFSFVTEIDTAKNAFYQPQLFKNSQGFIENNNSMEFNDWEETPTKITNKLQGKDRSPQGLNSELLPCFLFEWVVNTLELDISPNLEM
jgi:hypothetical protein